MTELVIPNIELPNEHGACWACLDNGRRCDGNLPGRFTILTTYLIGESRNGLSPVGLNAICKVTLLLSLTANLFQTVQTASAILENAQAMVFA